MAGRVQWEAQVDSNVAKLLSETKELRDQLDGIKKGNYEIKLNIDDKKLEKVISNLDKMLESLGKGTGDFKEFENLSKQLNEIVSEVKELNKAFGGINDSGVSNLLSSIQSIDKSLSSLSEHITNVNKDFGSVGKNASDNVGQINEAKKATEGLTEATRELANAQKNVGNKSNISSGKIKKYTVASKNNVPKLASKNTYVPSIDDLIDESFLEDIIEDLEKESLATKKATEANEEYIETKKKLNSLSSETEHNPDKDKEISKENNLLQNQSKEVVEIEQALNVLTERYIKLTNIVQNLTDGWGDVSNAVKDALQQLKLFDENGKFLGTLNEQGMVAQGAVMNGTHAIISRRDTTYARNGSYYGTDNYLDLLIKKEQEAYEQGINLARILSVIEGYDGIYEIQEQAKGNQVHDISKYSTLESYLEKCKIITEATDEQLQKLLKDAIALNNLGFKLDFGVGNILYDKNSGFSFIDLELRKLDEKIPETQDLVRGLFKSLAGGELVEKYTNNSLSNFASDDNLKRLHAMLSVAKRLQSVFDVSEVPYFNTIINAQKEASNALSTPIEDTFQGDTEASEMGKVATAVDEAVQAKKDFATANEGVQASVDGSKSKLELETELMERLAKSAREAADAKKEFVEANKQVQGSVDDTGKSVKKDKYKNKSKISEDEYTGKSDYYASIANQKLKNSGNTILGETVSTELVDGLVKVTAKIKTADDTWKTFSAKIDADGNMFEQRFRTITKGVDKLETELKNFGLETNPALSYGETLKKAEEIRSSLKLDDSYTIKVDSNELVTITQKLSDVKSSTTSVTQTFKSAQDAIEHFGKEASSSAEKTTVALKGVKASAESIGEAVGESLNFESIDKSLDKYNDKLRNFTVKPADGHRYPIYQKNIDDLTEKVSKLQTIRDNLSKKDINLISKEDIDEVNTLEKDIDELIFKMSKMSASEKGFDPLGADKALEKINSELKKNSAMSKEAKRQIQGFYDEIRSGNPSKPIKDLLNDMYKLIQAERLAGREGKSFMDIFKEKVVYGAAANLAGMIGIYDIINAGREGITVIRELDTALTEMRKVSDESLSSLERFQGISFDLADDVGTTGKQIQDSTASWMRLGEAMSEASESAQVSNILLNVSEFESIDEATESLVAMSAAYKDLEKIEIVDVLNKIGNEHSISTDGIATALQDSASALVTANNDLNEAVALITAGNAVTQDPNSVGAGMRTISLRLVGTEEAKAELEKLGEDVNDMVMTSSKVRETIMNATKAASKDGKGFDILDANGNYKSTYEIMQGLADLYDEIVAKDKELGTNNLNLLLETIAGKNRANIAASILQNGDMLRSVYEDAQNSDGSAQEELDKFLESIDGRMAKLENQAQEFWYKLIDSDTIKNGITLLTELLGLATDFVDTFGALGTAGLGAGLFASFKGAGRVKIAYPHLYTYACRNKTLYAQAYFYMLPCVKYTLEFRVELTTVCNLLHSRYDIPLHYGCTF